MAENKIVTIPLVDNYSYSVDNLYNYTLYYKSVKQVQAFGKRGVYTGKERETTETLGYYSSLEGLLRATVRDAARRGIEEGKITTIKQHLDELAAMEKKLTEITMGY